MWAHSVLSMKTYEFRTGTEGFLEGLIRRCMTNHREGGNLWAFKEGKFSVPMKY